MQASIGQLAYKDLSVWQKSMVFANSVIALIETLDTDRRIIDYLSNSKQR